MGKHCVQETSASYAYLEPSRAASSHTIMHPYRREVEIAQNGAARERAARAVAETALSKARESLKETHEMLMESLDNGPKAALAVLLEEKRAAEAKAAEAVATAEAATAEARKIRALRQGRGQEPPLPEKERDQVM